MAYRYLRTAGHEPINLDLVEKLRKDFLTLLKNLPRVKNYESAHELRNAFAIYRKRFDEFFFDHFLNHDVKYNFPEDEARWINSRLRSVAWSFSIEMSVPIGFADAYNNEQARFSLFERDFPQWKARVQRKAQAFWKEMKEVIDYYENVKKKPLTVKVPAVEKAVVEGFQLIMRGYDPNDEYNRDELAGLIEGLRRYRRRANQVAPILMKLQLPVIIEFKTTLDKGGTYNNDGTITFYASSILGKGTVDWIVHAMAHEMGHHLWRAYLSKDAQDFWLEAIRGDFGDLDIRELLRKWPEGAWAFEFPEKLGLEDPVLALQVDAISHDTSYGKLQSKEDFQKLLDAGTTTLRTPKNPITGYANKNPEEAFCEAVGLAVAYGGRTLLPEVKRWLGIILPEVRVASRVATMYAARVAASSALKKPGHHEYEVPCGSISVTLNLDIPDPKNDVSDKDRVPMASVEVDQGAMDRDLLVESEDDILSGVSRFLGKRVSWSEGDWGQNRPHGTWSRSIALPRR